jgi:hypothetical protein
MTLLICRSVLQILLRGTGAYVVFGQKADNYPFIFSHLKIYYVLYLRPKTDEDFSRTSRKELRSTEVMIFVRLEHHRPAACDSWRQCCGSMTF